MAESGLGRSTIVSIIGAFVAGVMGLLFAYVNDWIGPHRGEGRQAHAAPPSGGSQPPHPARPAGRAFRGPFDVLSALHADLKEAPESDRPRRRYLTLTHLHNHPARTDADLDKARAGLAELAGHLSPAGRAVVWRPLDAEKTIYRLDLGELGWDPEETWRQILKGYPYGLSFAEAADSAWREAEKEVQALTGARLAYVRADWFLAAVARPPLAGPGGPLKVPDRPLPVAVQGLAQAYAAQRLALEDAAAELARDEPAALEEFLRRDADRLRRLRLVPLLQPGGTIGRDAWESLEYATSPFQEVSQGLHLGTPLLFP